jgi:hypothetical protein
MMLSLARDLLKKTRDNQQVKGLTTCFWSDFMSNPGIMYGLFAETPRKLTYNPDRVKVMGTEAGMINQITVTSVEEIDLLHEEIMSSPVLLRVWAEFIHNDYIGAAHPGPQFEGDLALLVDTSHPMIHPEFERGLEWAKKTLQANERFCLQFDFGPAIDTWLRVSYPQGCFAVRGFRGHQARLYVTNYDKPKHSLDCNILWCTLLSPCWLLSAPCYKLYRRIKCRDLVITIRAPVVRRAVLPNGKIVEVTK